MKPRFTKGPLSAAEILQHERSPVAIQKTRWPQAVILFPAPYGTAVANLGFLSVWSRLNQQTGFTCDRAFWDSRHPSAPVGLTTGLPLHAFPLIFISSSFELDLIAVIDGLISSGIEPSVSARRNGPLIIAGGISPTLNPAPWGAIADIVLIGEGEEAIDRWMPVYSSLQEKGRGKKELLEASADLPFVWLPGMKDHTVEPAEYKSYTTYPTYSTAVHPAGHFGDCWLLETTRGCPRRCLFCAMCSAFPARFVDGEAAIELMNRTSALDAAKVGLVGAAVGDHPELKNIIQHILKMDRQVTLSSLRIERTDDTLLEMLVAGGLQTLTVAPEAGSEQVRKKIGKRATDADIIDLCRRAARYSLKKVRFYFVMNMPESEPDSAIPDLVKRIRSEIPRSLKIDLSISTFIPKPGTPWEGAPFGSNRAIDQLKQSIKQSLRSIPGVSAQFESTRSERLAALLSRGDEPLGHALIRSRKAARPLEQEMKESELDPSLYLQPDYQQHPSPWRNIKR